MNAKLILLLPALLLLLSLSLHAQGEREGAEGRETPYVEVTGTAELTLVPDEIHYIIEIKEYFAEEFEKKSKPEDYRTKVTIEYIETELRKSLHQAGVSDKDIRLQEAGDSWKRQRGKDFLVSKRFDITIHDFTVINEIVRRVDTHGINSMRIGDLDVCNRDSIDIEGKIKALQAARTKAVAMAEVVGAKIGRALFIVENASSGSRTVVRRASNKLYATASAADFVEEEETTATTEDNFRYIKRNYSVFVRFELDYGE